MKLKEIYEFIDTIAPFDSQLSFDNAGFLVGDKNEELTSAVVTLDVTDGAIEYARSVGANLIISHHPVIFEAVKSVTADSIIYKLIKSGISVISAHTNLDMAVGGINDLLCQKIGLENIEGILPEGDVFSARKGCLQAPLTADEFAAFLKTVFPSAAIKYADKKGQITTVGVCSGSGGSLLSSMIENGVDAFVTADVKHNVFLDSARANIAIYDCGHFDTEDIIVSPLKVKLKEKFGDKFYEYHSEIIKVAEAPI